MKMAWWSVVATFVLATATAAGAVSDLGNPNVTRLWAETAEGREVACTAAYVRSPQDNRVDSVRAWVLTAAHCAGVPGALLARSADTTTLAVPSWVVSVRTWMDGLSLADYAIGIVAETRERPDGFWLGSKMPDGGRVFVHGFPDGVERVSSVRVVPPHIQPKTAAPIPAGSRYVIFPVGEILGGSSGSPVLDGQGRVVGILWGIFTQPAGVVFPGAPPELQGQGAALVTPIESLLSTFKGLAR